MNIDKSKKTVGHPHKRVKNEIPPLKQEVKIIKPISKPTNTLEWFSITEEINSLISTLTAYYFRKINEMKDTDTEWLVYFEKKLEDYKTLSKSDFFQDYNSMQKTVKSLRKQVKELNI